MDLQEQQSGGSRAHASARERGVHLHPSIACAFGPCADFCWEKCGPRACTPRAPPQAGTVPRSLASLNPTRG